MKIKIQGIAPHIDGEYDVPEPYTNRELNEIKLASGVLPFEVGRSYFNGDAAFKAAIAVITLRRVGKHAPLDLFLDSHWDSALFVVPGLEEALAEPPDPTKGSRRKSSGKGSRSSSATQEADQNPSGEPT